MAGFGLFLDDRIVRSMYQPVGFHRGCGGVILFPCYAYQTMCTHCNGRGSVELKACDPYYLPTKPEGWGKQ